MNMNKKVDILSDKNKKQNDNDFTYYTNDLNIEHDNNFQVGIKVESVECINGDKNDMGYITNININEMYENHTIKEELVIGPDVIQKSSENPLPAEHNNDDYENIIISNLLEDAKTKRCNICQKIFASKCSLSKHKRYIHALQKRTYTCEICGKVYKQKEYYDNHTTIHRIGTIEKRFRCMFCSITFADRTNCNRHIIRCYKNPDMIIQEKKILKFICDVCNKSYTRKDSLENHVRDHFNMTLSYQCNGCSKKYKHKHGLKAHVQSKHLNNKTHFCRICKKGYFSRWGMVQHERQCSVIIVH